MAITFGSLNGSDVQLVVSASCQPRCPLHSREAVPNVPVGQRWWATVSMSVRTHQMPLCRDFGHLLYCTTHPVLVISADLEPHWSQRRPMTPLRHLHSDATLVDFEINSN
jgi:hypothetical protein